MKQNNHDEGISDAELPMSHDPLFDAQDDEFPHINTAQQDEYGNFDIDEYHQPEEEEFDDESDTRSLDEINVTTDNVGDTRNKHALVIEACRRIAIAQDLPYVAALFGTHERRLAFLSSQFTRMPPPTPMQIEIIVNTYEPGDNPAGVMQSMDKAATYIERKAEAYRPPEELMNQARQLSERIKSGIPRYAIFNEKKLKAWMKENGS